MTNIASHSETAPRIHLLNIDNDGALGAGTPSYTPPAHAHQLQRDIELLPLWWASDGDAIIAPRHSTDEIRRLADKAGVDLCIEGTHESHDPAPWGWSSHAAAIFKANGVAPTHLPAEETIAEIRRLSHRSTAIEINRHLRLHGFATPNEPVLLTSPDELIPLLHSGRRILLKRPWSSSGRGIFPTDTMTEAQALSLAGGIIRRQGSVVAEVLLDKRADFAALFHACDGHVSHRAWSSFHTSGDGRYGGNLIAPQEQILATIGYHRRELERLATLLEEILGSIIGDSYQGWLGIDMLVAEDSGGAAIIAPCIEMNLRMTMGVVAHLLSLRPEFAGQVCQLMIVPAAAPLPARSVCLTPGAQQWAMVVSHPCQ